MCIGEGLHKFSPLFPTDIKHIGGSLVLGGICSKFFPLFVFALRSLYTVSLKLQNKLNAFYCKPFVPIR